MSIIPGEKLHYAETHFKFKLPWSLLYRPWPEILMDAPFQFVPGTEPTLWLVIRDAHRFPTLVEKIEVSASSCENNEINVSKVIDLDIQATKQFEFHPVKIGTLKSGNYEIHCKIHAKRIDPQSGNVIKTASFSRWNYPRLKPSPLKIQILAEEPPKAPGFVATRTTRQITLSTGQAQRCCSRQPRLLGSTSSVARTTPTISPTPPKTTPKKPNHRSPALTHSTKKSAN